ncbi:MAG: hypothetical protein QOD32_2982 [Pyrinomonadaceae bacterium]|jgi:hypothetical protein|nr:hypothetical protein [Pyrinomonadaceae bacterium]
MPKLTPFDDAVRIAAEYLSDHDIPPQDASPQMALNALAEWSRKNPDTEVGSWMLETYDMVKPKTLQGTVTAEEVSKMKAGKSPTTLAGNVNVDKWDAVRIRFEEFRKFWAEYQQSLPLSNDIFDISDR